MTTSLSKAQSGGLCVNFTSWNVKGLNNVIKLNKVLSHLEHLNTHIGFYKRPT